MRYLAAQRTRDAAGARHRAVRRRVRDLRPRQRRGARRGAVRGTRRAADVARAQRAGDGAHGDRLRQGEPPAAHDGVHHLDRPGRHQPRHRGGAGARQPPAGAVPPRRRLRVARTRPRVAAGRVVRRRHGVGQRLPATRVALFRPHRASAAAADCAAARHRGADRCRAVRTGDARAAAGRAGRGVRLSRGLFRAARRAAARGAGGGCRSRGRGGAAARQAPPADHRRRRRAVQRRRPRGVGALRRRAWRRGRRDAGRQERAGVRPSAAGRRHRRHRRHGGECARARCRRHPRRRHAAVRLHHGLACAVRRCRRSCRSTCRRSMR